MSTRVAVVVTTLALGAGAFLLSPLLWPRAAGGPSPAMELLPFFILIGRYLDELVRSRARGAAENLLGLKSLAATVINIDGTTRRIAARALEPAAAGEVRVVPAALAGEPGVDGVVEVVRPDGIEPEAPLGRRQDDLSVVVVRLGHDVRRPAEAGGSPPR